MADRLKEIPAKIMEWWNKFTTRQKSIIVGIGAVVVFTFAIIMYVISQPNYVSLVNCEDEKQTSEVVEALDSAGIVYNVSSDGLKIEVEANQESQARLAIASAGVMPSGVSLQDALGNSMSTTSSDKEKLYKAYMESYITETLMGMSAVKSARVHLDVAIQDGTLSAKKEESSAYIQLELSDTFTSANAANMARAVATMLGNDTTANITILDSDSNMLFTGGDDYSTAGIANSMQELQNQAESYMANQVKKVLLGTKQFNNIEVTSHLDMDFSSYQETVKEYYANDDREEGMIARIEEYEDENSSNGGGIPGTDSNGGTDSTDGTSYVSPDSSNTSSSTSEKLIDYLPNESLVSKDTPAGAIKHATSTVSIAAITYKEIYEETVERQGLLDGDLTWEDYKEANKADIKKEVDPELYQLVANATGINADHITIIAYESPLFYDKEPLNITWQNSLSVIMLIVILALLAFVVLRSMRLGREVEAEEELSVEHLLQSTPESELDNIEIETKSETRKMIEKFVDDNPELAAALLRNWLNEDWG